jgi:hypothetical protein
MKCWLENIPWENIVKANQVLCEKADCMHAVSRNGTKAENLWETQQDKKMSLEEMVMFCKRIHFIEPFVMLNGNTLAAVAIHAIQEMIPKTCSKYDLEESICTIIAGTVQGLEEKILKRESDEIDPPLQIM